MRNTAVTLLAASIIAVSTIASAQPKDAPAVTPSPITMGDKMGKGMKDAKENMKAGMKDAETKFNEGMRGASKNVDSATEKMREEFSNDQMGGRMGRYQAGQVHAITYTGADNVEQTRFFEVMSNGASGGLRFREVDKPGGQAKQFAKEGADADHDWVMSQFGLSKEKPAMKDGAMGDDNMSSVVGIDNQNYYVGTMPRRNGAMRNSNQRERDTTIVKDEALMEEGGRKMISRETYVKGNNGQYEKAQARGGQRNRANRADNDTKADEQSRMRDSDKMTGEHDKMDMDKKDVDHDKMEKDKKSEKN